MAQLKSTTINGNLTVTGDIVTSNGASLNKLWNNLHTMYSLVRTSGPWMLKAYTAYEVCEKTVPEAGIYLITASCQVNEPTDYTHYYFGIEVGGNMAVKITKPGTKAFSVCFNAATLVNIKAGDYVQTIIQGNYKKDSDSLMGKAIGSMQILKIT